MQVTTKIVEQPNNILIIINYLIKLIILLALLRVAAVNK
jgi:hypothetical protein